ncbi:MAG: aminotransferase class I and II [Calditrichaeota bacterium]|nr:aminotransferase class I and II [Calditrichota bacterium]RQV99683.1 MAG: aminotransferase class I and II [Calditrichota bacterium]
MNNIRTLTATEYIEPLREGGSLPAIVRADDEKTYVMKFIGAGQGTRALIAELIAGEIARVLGFNIPELVFLVLDPVIGNTEPDAEIQDLLRASAGLNLGIGFLRHSAEFNLLVPPHPTPEFASRLVWFDAFVTNFDRSAKNVNMLIHREKIWLIDHGACLTFHHNWQNHLMQSETAFPYINQHVLLHLAAQIPEADRECKSRLNSSVFGKIISLIPDSWLNGLPFNTPTERRKGYLEFLNHRLEVTEYFVKEAIRARSQIV